MNKNILNIIYISLLIEFTLICLYIKTYIINTLFIKDDNSFYYRIFQTISHDSIIYFLFFLLVFLSYQKKINYYISVILRIISSFLIFLYLLDIYILYRFATHLNINDALKFKNYIFKYINQNYTFDSLIISLGIVLVIIILVFIFKKPTFNSSKINYFYIIFLTILLILSLFKDNGRYIHSWLFKNFIEYNFNILGESKEYTNEFIKKQNYSESYNCVENKVHPKQNIIILMVESFASYQSNYFSGINNWTPNLDEIAKENIGFKNFFANGFVTEDAEIAIITGEFPLYAPTNYSNGGGVSFSGFYNSNFSLPNIIKKQSYHSEFITSSDLNFSNTGNWAKSNGFDYIEGSNHPFYNNKQKYHFDAAADEYLFKRVLNRIKKQDSNYFMFIKTVSSHAPFKNPKDNSSSEEGTIKYVDEQIGIFYKNLENIDFFSNGILIILGDHHPVIPLKSKEIDKFGLEEASSRVPMILIKEKEKKIVNEYYQQTDIYNSLKNLYSHKTCVSDWKGDFLSLENPKVANYIIHRRGDIRGTISVFNKKDTYNIKLNGNYTSISSKNKDSKKIISKINDTRIKRLNPRFNYKD